MVKYANSFDWFEVVKHKEYLYVLRERLDEIDPRFYTMYSNMFLLMGSHSALLIDTGSGLFPIKPIIDDIISERRLIVINTHAHFDHIGGNNEFSDVKIHKKECKEISKPIDVSFLKDSPRKIINRFSKIGFIIPPVHKAVPINDGDEIDLGGITVRIIYTPGHSKGSICLLTSGNELFTGDTAHYGTMYLTKKTFPMLLSSLAKLFDYFQKSNIELYPSHEDFCVDKSLLIKLDDGIRNFENIWNTRIRDDFLEAWILSDNNFKYVIF